MTYDPKDLREKVKAVREKVADLLEEELKNNPELALLSEFNRVYAWSKTGGIPSES